MRYGIRLTSCDKITPPTKISATITAIAQPTLLKICTFIGSSEPTAPPTSDASDPLAQISSKPTKKPRGIFSVVNRAGKIIQYNKREQNTDASSKPSVVCTNISDTKHELKMASAKITTDGKPIKCSHLRVHTIRYTTMVSATSTVITYTAMFAPSLSIIRRL